MVSICDGMKTFQMRLVPGLLRTHAYGRAVIVASHAWQTAEEDDQFVQVRMARQERPTGDTPLEFWAVLMEGVLRQRVGRPIVMHDQLQHLADLEPFPSPC